MNSTFKVVFNKARGALMVVNEVTSSVQAKGTKTVVATAVAAMIAGVAGTAMAADPIEVTEEMTAIVDRNNNDPGYNSEPLHQSKFELKNNVTITNNNLLGAHDYIAMNADVDLGDKELTLVFKKSDITFGPVRNVYFHGSDSSILTLDNQGTGYASTLGAFHSTTKIDVGTLNLLAEGKYGIYMSDQGNLDINAGTITINSLNGTGALIQAGSSMVMNDVSNLTINAAGAGIQTWGSSVQINAAKTGAQISITGGHSALTVISKSTDSSSTSVTINNPNGKNTLTATNGSAVMMGAYTPDLQSFGDGTNVLNIIGKTNELIGEINLVQDGGTLNLSGESSVTGDVDVHGTLGVAGSLALGGEKNYIATLENVQPAAQVFAARAGADQVTLKILNPNSTTTIGTNSTNLLVMADGEVNDEVGGIDGFLGGDTPTLSVGNNTNTGSVKISLAEGLVEGEVTAELKDDGTVNEDTVVEKINSVQDATLDLTVSLPLTITRALTNDVRKRLGDIRSAQGTHGVWARYDGGKMSGGSGEFDHKFNTVQIGIDTVPTRDSARFGVAFSYTQGDTDFGRGSSDMDAFSLAAYGTWIADNGLFADVIGRIATVKNDMTVGQYKGKTDNTLLSLSGELGWRYDVTNMLYVEPQAELTYTYIDGDKFKLGYADYETDSADSLVGRAGFALGIKCPNNKGDAYVRVSAVHEFLGDSMVTASAGNTINTAEFDGKDTWVEYGIGASYNVTPNTYIWADIERTSGAVVDEDVRGTVGVRFSF